MISDTFSVFRRQAEFFKSLHLAFVEGSLESLLGEQSKYAGELAFQPLSVIILPLPLSELLADILANL